MQLQVQDLPLIFMTLRARQEWICSILEIVLEDSILTQHSRWLRILEAPRRRVKSSWNLRRWIMHQKKYISFQQQYLSFIQFTKRSRTQKIQDHLRTLLNVWSCMTKWKMAQWCWENWSIFCYLLVSFYYYFYCRTTLLQVPFAFYVKLSKKITKFKQHFHSWKKNLCFQIVWVWPLMCFGHIELSQLSYNFEAMAQSYKKDNG